MKWRFLFKSKRKIGFIIVLTFTANVIMLYASLSFLLSRDQGQHNSLTNYEKQRLAYIEEDLSVSDMDKVQKNRQKQFKSKKFLKGKGQMDFKPTERNSKLSNNKEVQQDFIASKRIGKRKNNSSQNNKMTNQQSDDQHNIPQPDGLKIRADNKHVLEEINALANENTGNVYHMYDDNLPIRTSNKVTDNKDLGNKDTGIVDKNNVAENLAQNNDISQEIPKTFDENYIKYFWKHPEFRNLKVDSKEERDPSDDLGYTIDVNNKKGYIKDEHIVRNANKESPINRNRENAVKHKEHAIVDQPKDESFVTMYPARGKLGNQMFQLASLLGIAERGNFTPFLQLSQFELKEVFKFPKTFSRDIDTSKFKKFSESNYTQDVSLKFSKNLNSRMNWSLDGWFQSFKYFSDVSEKVRHYFRFKKHLVHTALEFIQKTVPVGHKTVAIHVRRGDFISAYEMKLGRIEVPPEYFQKAMKHYQSKFDKITFVVVSDDMRWCKEYIKGDNVVYSTFYHNEKGVDLALISHCDHVIVSVGTYGWWGGWLSRGTVVYYNKFPTPGSKLDRTFVSRNYYPSNWIPLE